MAAMTKSKMIFFLISKIIVHTLKKIDCAIAHDDMYIYF